MNRPAIAYLLMIVVLIAGLWVLLEMGSHLSAPEDLAGRWQLQSNIHGIPDDGLQIEQSGRFFQVAFDHGPAMNLKLADRNGSTLHLADGESKLTVSGAPDSDDKTIELSGSSVGRWTAHRAVRAFPLDVSTQEGH